MSDLVTRLEAFNTCHIVCLGDLMLDRYIYGTVDRISPEAPIPVLRRERENISLGGAGNVARNIAALGGHVAMIGLIGEDKGGRDLIETFGLHPNVSLNFISDAQRPTTEKTRYVANGQQLLRADHETTLPLTAQQEDFILAQLRAALTKESMVILSDYAKGVLTPRVLTESMALCKAMGCKILIDPKGRDFSRYAGAFCLTPNRKELAEASGLIIDSVEMAEKAARFLIDTYKIEAMLVKLGGEGVCLVGRSSPAVHYHTKAREVFDVSGAGDTVAATFALAIAAGYSMSEAAELANIAGSLVVAKVGTAAVSRDEIARELIYGGADAAENKVVGLTTIQDRAERWRHQGLKVGFTNGCFDLLHPGHIALIRQARAACDRLVIGLNSDASVKRLKGDSRPVQSEGARSAVLSSLADVDAVVIFSEDTPFELIKTVRPDTLIKGADYTLDKIVGADLVKGWGGKVVLAHLVEGQSTTQTIARMAK